MTRTRRVRPRRLPRPSQLRKTRTVPPALSRETPLLERTQVTLRTRPTERTAHPDRTAHMGRARDGQVAPRLEPVGRTEAMPPETRPMAATPMPRVTRPMAATPMPPKELPEQMLVGQRRQTAVAHRPQLARSPASQERKSRRAIEVGTFVLFKPTT